MILKKSLTPQGFTEMLSDQGITGVESVIKRYNIIVKELKIAKMKKDTLSIKGVVSVKVLILQDGYE